MTFPGSSAFPYQAKNGSVNSGLNKREYFAAIAMQSVLTWQGEDAKDKDFVASKAVDYADALIDALNRIPIPESDGDTSATVVSYLQTFDDD